MVNFLKRTLLSLYHFMGGVYFALILIASTALFVVVGTVLESQADSHLYAAELVYERPWFSMLLWGFFFNILFSAIRRWPFKLRHLAFLTTHLGLLMILAGTLAKHYFGFQGSMSLIEGSGSHTISKSEELSLNILKKGEQEPIQIVLADLQSEKFPVWANEAGVQLHLLHYYPNTLETLSGWIKGEYGIVRKIDHPLKVYKHHEQNLTLSGRIIEGVNSWHLYVLHTDHLQDLLTTLYAQEGRIRFTERQTGKLLVEAPLKEALRSPLPLDKFGKVSTHLIINLSSDKEIESAFIEAAFDAAIVKIPLIGPNTLLNSNTSTPFFGEYPIAIDLIFPPTIAIVEAEAENVHLIALHPHGNLWHQLFKSEVIEELIVYDEGFAGYGLHTVIPMGKNCLGREEKEAALAMQLMKQLKKAENDRKPFAPPLQMLKDACEKLGADFPSICLSFFKKWSSAHLWAYPKELNLSDELKTVFQNLEWEHPSIKQGALLAHSLIKSIEAELLLGKNFLTVLKEMRWPLLESFDSKTPPAFTPEETEEALTLITQQVFAAAQQLSQDKYVEEPLFPSAEWQASLLSLYLRAYQIHLHSILPKNFTEQELSLFLDEFVSDHSKVSKEIPDLTLETALFSKHTILPSQKKREENHPAISLRLINAKRADQITLGFDRTGKGIKWPALNGEYLLRLQPTQLEIPYRVRLRRANRINFPNSAIPYSFESELIFTDRRSGEHLEKRISMNHVHETWEGYRFYLASIAPQEEGSVKRVQIIVNHDPGKYWLTYPGAVLLTCGILLLFWINPYRF